MQKLAHFSIVARIAWLGSVFAFGCGVDVDPGLDTFGTGTAGTDETGEPCESALAGLPEQVLDDACKPGSPVDACEGMSMVVPQGTVVFTDTTSPSTQEAEISSVEVGGVSYFTTIESEWAAGPCVVQKRVRVFRRASGTIEEVLVDPPGDGPNEDLQSDPNTPGVGVWYTDPYLATPGGDGAQALYLSVLKYQGIEEPIDCEADRSMPSSDYENEAQLWVLSPGGSALQKVAFAEDGDIFTSLISQGVNESHIGGGIVDHPRIAVFSISETQDRVVVTWVGDPADGFATLLCTHDPEEGSTSCIRQSGPEAIVASESDLFPNPAFDSEGNLYIARLATGSPIVRRLSWTGSGWSFVDGGPAPHPDNFSYPVAAIGSSTGPISTDPTPAIAITRLGDASTESVFLAWAGARVAPGGSELDGVIAIAAANVNDLDVWRDPILVLQGPTETDRANDWSPELRVVGRDRNTLDVAFYRGPASTEDSFGPVLQDTDSFTVQLARYRAHDLLPIGQATMAVSDEQRIVVGGLPRREPGVATELFTGEYAGLATLGSTGTLSTVGWPQQQAAVGEETPRPDLASTNIDTMCLGSKVVGGTGAGWRCEIDELSVVETSCTGEPTPNCDPGDVETTPVLAPLVELIGEDAFRGWYVYTSPDTVLDPEAPNGDELAAVRARCAYACELEYAQDPSIAADCSASGAFLTPQLVTQDARPAFHGIPDEEVRGGGLFDGESLDSDLRTSACEAFDEGVCPQRLARVTEARQGLGRGEEWSYGTDGVITIDSDALAEPVQGTLVGTLGGSLCSGGNETAPCPLYIGSATVELEDPVTVVLACGGQNVTHVLDTLSLSLAQPAFGIMSKELEVWSAFPSGGLVFDAHTVVDELEFDTFLPIEHGVGMMFEAGWAAVPAYAKFEVTIGVPCNNLVVEVDATFDLLATSWLGSPPEAEITIESEVACTGNVELTVDTTDIEDDIESVRWRIDGVLLEANVTEIPFTQAHEVTAIVRDCRGATTTVSKQIGCE